MSLWEFTISTCIEVIYAMRLMRTHLQSTELWGEHDIYFENLWQQMRDMSFVSSIHFITTQKITF